MLYPKFSPSHLRFLALAALTALLLSAVPFSLVHADLARDLFIAWRFDHAQAFPLSGPLLAGTIHLGPIYYWLLGLFLIVGRGWLGATLLLGLLAVAQIPLAYLLGKEIHSRRAGLLWAVLLVAPSWTSLEWVFPGPNLLTPTLTLAFFLCALRYVRTARFRYLAGMALAFVLALHAHPSTVGLAWIGAGVLIFASIKGRCRARDVLLAALLGLVPLMPYFVWDAINGFADLRAGADYLGAGEKTGSLSMAIPILWAAAVGGTQYWFETVLGWTPVMVRMALVATVLCGVFGLAGLVKASVFGPHRKTILIGIASVAAILLTIALIRSMTPYYMTTVLRISLTGLVAIGLASLGESRSAGGVRIFSMTAALAAMLICTVAGARHAVNGTWPFGFFPMFNVVGEKQPAAPTLFLPAFAVARSGRFLCNEQAPSAHGSLGKHLLYNYAIDMRLACGRNDVVIGGSDPARQHWLGLSRVMFAALGRVPTKRFGPLGVVPAQPLSDHAIPVPATPVYPPYLANVDATPSTRSFEVTLRADQYLVVSNLAYFVADPEVRIAGNGRTLRLRAVDSVSRVYGCDGCARDTDVVVTVTVASPDLADVDIVVI